MVLICIAEEMCVGGGGGYQLYLTDHVGFICYCELRVVRYLVCVGYSRVTCGPHLGLFGLLPGYVWCIPWSV